MIYKGGGLMAQYLECPRCGKRRDTRKTKFHQVGDEKICHRCYLKEIPREVAEYINEELRTKISPESFIKVATLDLGALTNTRTKAYETALRTVVRTTAVAGEDFEFEKDDFEYWIEKKGGYRTPVDEIIRALIEAGFLIEVGNDTFRAGENSIELANRWKSGDFKRDRDVIQKAFGILNMTLLKDGKHVLWITAILEAAQRILEEQKKTGTLTFEIHLSDFLKIARDVGLSDIHAINNLEKCVGLTAESPPEPAFFDDIYYIASGSLDPGDLDWNIGLVMKKEWVQLRERLNQRMRYIWV